MKNIVAYGSVAEVSAYYFIGIDKGHFTNHGINKHQISASYQFAENYYPEACLFCGLPNGKPKEKKTTAENDIFTVTEEAAASITENVIRSNNKDSSCRNVCATTTVTTVTTPNDICHVYSNADYYFNSKKVPISLDMIVHNRQPSMNIFLYLSKNSLGLKRLVVQNTLFYFPILNRIKRFIYIG